MYKILRQSVVGNYLPINVTLTLKIKCQTLFGATMFLACHLTKFLQVLRWFVIPPLQSDVNTAAILWLWSCSFKQRKGVYSEDMQILFSVRSCILTMKLLRSEKDRTNKQATVRPTLTFPLNFTYWLVQLTFTWFCVVFVKWPLQASTILSCLTCTWGVWVEAGNKLNPQASNNCTQVVSLYSDTKHQSFRQ